MRSCKLGSQLQQDDTTEECYMRGSPLWHFEATPWTGIVFTRMETATVTANTKAPNKQQIRSSQVHCRPGHAPFSSGTPPSPAAETTEWLLWRGCCPNQRFNPDLTKPVTQDSAGNPFSPALQHTMACPSARSVSFLQLCSFSGTVFWGLWFSAKRNLKNKTLVHYIMAPVMSRNILHLIKSPQITFWKPAVKSHGWKHKNDVSNHWIAHRSVLSWC